MEILKRWARRILFNEIEEMRLKLFDLENRNREWCQEINRLEDLVTEKNNFIKQLTKELNKPILKDPLAQSIDQARHHAAQHSIKELTIELEHIQKQFRRSKKIAEEIYKKLNRKTPFNQYAEELSKKLQLDSNEH